jgi:predicted acylesterase/phospholipase RssA
MAIVMGCGGNHREQAPGVVFDAPTTPVGFHAIVRYANGFANADPRAIETRFSEVLRLRHGASPGGTLNILALSGGGAGGAFGAGALVGLTQRGERPQFDVVSGVSAGALIAPFAFLGPTWDAQLTDAFSSARAEQALGSPSIGILLHPGIYGSEALVGLVDHFITDEVIRAVAQQAATGRLLLVATTDLDKQETVIWDMGRIAAHGGEGARVLFRNVLVASASIPGVFPPIVIPVENAGVRYDEMHVDGDTTVPFFVVPALAYARSSDAKRLKGANIYLLVNSQLGGLPKTTPVDAISIVSRSVSATLIHLARTNVLLTSDFARENDMNFKLSSIPIAYPFQGPLDFRESSIRALFNYGAECARKGRLWTAAVDQAMTRGQGTLSVKLDERQATDAQGIPSCPLDAGPAPLRSMARLD